MSPIDLRITKEGSVIESRTIYANEQPKDDYYVRTYDFGTNVSLGVEVYVEEDNGSEKWTLVQRDTRDMRNFQEDDFIKVDIALNMPEAIFYLHTGEKIQVKFISLAPASFVSKTDPKT